MQTENKTMLEYTIEYKNFKYTLHQDDWEKGNWAICTKLITKEQWETMCKAVEKSVVEFMDNYPNEDFEFIENFLMGEYETELLHNCDVFFYDDLSDDDIAIITDKQCTEYVVRKIYEKLQKEEQNDDGQIKSGTSVS